MKLVIVVLCLCISACATRRVPDNSTWFADCYNKQRQESMLAQAEAHLSSGDVEGRRRIRKLFWDLQKECR